MGNYKIANFCCYGSMIVHCRSKKKGVLLNYLRVKISKKQHWADLARNPKIISQQKIKGLSTFDGF